MYIYDYISAVKYTPKMTFQIYESDIYTLSHLQLLQASILKPYIIYYVHITYDITIAMY